MAKIEGGFLTEREEQLTRAEAAKLPDECLIRIVRNSTSPIVEVRVSGHPVANGSITFADSDDETIAHFLGALRLHRP